MLKEFTSRLPGYIETLVCGFAAYFWGTAFFATQFTPDDELNGRRVEIVQCGKGFMLERIDIYYGNDVTHSRTTFYAKEGGFPRKTSFGDESSTPKHIQLICPEKVYQPFPHESRILIRVRPVTSSSPRFENCILTKAGGELVSSYSHFVSARRKAFGAIALAICVFLLEFFLNRLLKKRFLDFSYLAQSCQAQSGAVWEVLARRVFRSDYEAIVVNEVERYGKAGTSGEKSSNSKMLRAEVWLRASSIQVANPESFIRSVADDLFAPAN